MSKSVESAEARLAAARARAAQAEAALDAARRAAVAADRKREAARKIVFGGYVIALAAARSDLARYLQKCLSSLPPGTPARDAALLSEVALRLASSLQHQSTQHRASVAHESSYAA